MSANHIVLLNDTAGSMASSRVATIRERFEAKHMPVDVRLVAKGDDIGEAAKRAVIERPKVLVAGGGDGTLNAVAEAVAGTQVVFGVLPLGTLNHFAKDLGIPLDTGAAIDTISSGHVKEVDVGRVNGRLFLNNSSIGLYPLVVRRRDRLTQHRRRGKWAAFAWAAGAVLRQSPFLTVEIKMDDQSISCRTPLVFVGNNVYDMNVLEFGERQRLDAGCLSVYMIKGEGRLHLITVALRAMLGRLSTARDFASFTAHHVVIRTPRQTLFVAMDGEVHRLDTPLVYESQPRQVRVLVPPEPL